MASELSPGVAESNSASPLASSPQRKEKGMVRPIVRIIRCSTRLLDEDNLWGSVKPLLDQLRSAHLIPGDDPASIELKVEQTRVKHRNQQGTGIEITYHDA